MAKKTYIDLNNLTLYHNNLKQQLDTRDRTIIETIEEVSETVGENIEDLQQSVTTLENTTNELYQKSVHIELLNLTLEQQEQARENINADIDEVKNSDIENLPLPEEIVDTLNETIQIYVESNIISTSNIEISVYYNNSEEVQLTVYTNGLGKALVVIPLGTDYRLHFLEILGCEIVPDINSTALLTWKFIKVEYTNRNEKIVISTYKRVDGVNSIFPNCKVMITIENEPTQTLYTDENGELSFDVFYGKLYTITLDSIDEYYIKDGEYTKTFTASKKIRGINFEYRYFNIGLYFVCSDGVEYSLTDFNRALDDGTKNPEDAIYIKVSTPELMDYNGIFMVDIDDLAYRTVGTGSWGMQGTVVTTIPLNSGNAGEPYYYDGLGACKLVRKFCVDNDYDINALLPSATLDETHTFNNEIHSKFLGSLGQWAILWANRFLVDEMILTARPNGLKFSTFTTNKWTSAQVSATNAWYWASTASSISRNVSCSVVPFFA